MRRAEWLRRYNEIEEWYEREVSAATSHGIDVHYSVYEQHDDALAELAHQAAFLLGDPQ